MRLSGKVPQVCCLFGPSAAGGAYIPSFCDIVIMVEGNASMYLGSPRMSEMATGEKVTMEEMGGARMHCSVSGLGDVLAATKKQLESVANSIDKAEVRTRAMQRQLKVVEALPETEAQRLLGAPDDPGS